MKIFCTKFSNFASKKNHTYNSYQILAPAQMQAEKDVKKAAAVCLEIIKLDPENYRLGHTKVFNSSNYK